MIEFIEEQYRLLLQLPTSENWLTVSNFSSNYSSPMDSYATTANWSIFSRRWTGPRRHIVWHQSRPNLDVELATHSWLLEPSRALTA